MLYLLFIYAFERGRYQTVIGTHGSSNAMLFSPAEDEYSDNSIKK